MAVPVHRPYLGLVALTWALSVVSLGLSAHAIAAGTIFPNGEFHGILIQSVFAWTYNTLFSTVFLVGSLVASTSVFFGAAAHFVVFFLGFLQAIVSAGSFSAIINKLGYPEMTNIYKAFYGVGFTAAFIVMFTAIWAGLTYVSGRATEPAPTKPEKEEHFFPAR
ncbi:uncharacterized protein JCM10292_000550 [Rhodotorula paludigena]|uniref:uncharacterized protein n=1 Tax=Rhodotorula paludigena TaxID=86838 RepID=UPI0031795D47